MSKLVTSMIYAIAFFLLSAGMTEMANAETWILNDSPIPENEVEATIELYSEQKTMGPGGTKKSIEASIILGRQHVYAPRTGDQEPPAPTIAPNPNKSSYYLVEMPFTINPLTDKRDYEELTIEIDLTTNGATAFRMFPNNVVTKEDAEKRFDLSAKLASKGINLGGSRSYIVAFENIRPLIIASGEGRRNFSWIFKRQEGNPLLPGNRRTLILLEVMQGTEVVRGMLHSKGSIEGLFPWSDPRNLGAESHSVEWNLKNAGTLDDIPWKIDEVMNRSLM